MKIYYRMCEKEQSISYVTRYRQLSKKLLLRKCWASLKDQFEPEDKIIIIHDAVSPETLEWVENSLKPNIKREYVAVPDHSWEYHLHNIMLWDTLDKEIKVNPGTENSYHFLVEDDYLYKDNALSVIKSIETHFRGFFTPQDYPDRYLNPEPAQIFLGPVCHWRTVTSSTQNMGGSEVCWKHYMEILKESGPTSNDKVLEDIYKQTPCLNPLPGVASHLTENHATPYFNIAKRFEEINIG